MKTYDFSKKKIVIDSKLRKYYKNKYILKLI